MDPNLTGVIIKKKKGSANRDPWISFSCWNKETILQMGPLRMLLLKTKPSNICLWNRRDILVTMCLPICRTFIGQRAASFTGHWVSGDGTLRQGGMFSFSREISNPKAKHDLGELYLCIAPDLGTCLVPISWHTTPQRKEVTAHNKLRCTHTLFGGKGSSNLSGRVCQCLVGYFMITAQ